MLEDGSDDFSMLMLGPVADFLFGTLPSIDAARDRIGAGAGRDQDCKEACPLAGSNAESRKSMSSFAEDG